jgi:anti-anti-sigma factor
MLLPIRERRIEPDITVVELAGRLALGRESQRIETLVAELIGKGELRVIFDMTRMETIDSAGIGLVALAAGKLKASGGRLVVAAPEGCVLQLLTMTPVTAMVTVCPTVMEAADVLGPAPPLSGVARACYTFEFTPHRRARSSVG